MGVGGDRRLQSRPDLPRAFGIPGSAPPPPAPGLRDGSPQPQKPPPPRYQRLPALRYGKPHPMVLALPHLLGRFFCCRLGAGGGFCLVGRHGSPKQALWWTDGLVRYSVPYPSLQEKVQVHSTLQLLPRFLEPRPSIIHKHLWPGQRRGADSAGPGGAGSLHP